MNQFKNIAIIISFVFVVFMTHQVNAGVYFLVGNDEKVTSSSTTKCQGRGYNLLSCPAGKVPIDLCPDNSRYFKSCGCAPEFKFNSTNCPYPATLGSEKCEGKSKTCVCPSEYSIEVKDCAAPSVLGNVCKTKTESCTCPAKFDKLCNGNGQIGTGLSCNNKYEACSCNVNYKKCAYRGEVGEIACNIGDGDMFKACRNPTCSEIGLKSNVPVGETCREVPSYNVNCYDSCQETCSYFGLMSNIPPNNTCNSIIKNGKTCYSNCKII